jgi:hypothetical protein
VLDSFCRGETTLADGRVLSAGGTLAYADGVKPFAVGRTLWCSSGNPDQGHQVNWEPPDPNEELRMEVYSPPYLSRGARPTIGPAPTECPRDRP